MARGQRVRLASGIYQDRYGIAAVVKVGTHRDEGRFPPDTPLEQIDAWRLRRRAELVLQRGTVAPRGSLAADIRAYLADLPPGATTRDYTILLNHWRDSPIGPQRRDGITEQDIRRQLNVWKSQGAAASTLKHRLRVLRILYRHLDGASAPNPTTGITIAQNRNPPPREIPLALVEQLLANLPDRGQPTKGEARGTVSLTKIRLRVMAWTGLPQMQLVRLRATDVNFIAGKMRLRPRHKGQGVAGGAWVTLIPPALEALRDYAAAKLWETSFSRDSMNASWKRTIARTRKQLEAQAQETGDTAPLEAFERAIPDGCRPYDLRHSFLTEAYRHSGDLGAVAELGQHSDLRTTRRYTGGAVSARAEAAIAAMSARWKTEAK